MAANQWTGFYKITASVMKELIHCCASHLTSLRIMGTCIYKMSGIFAYCQLVIIIHHFRFICSEYAYFKIGFCDKTTKKQLDTGHKFNVKKTFRWHAECLLNVLCALNLRLVYSGLFVVLSPNSIFK